jgi:hypothetical protein
MALRFTESGIMDVEVTALSEMERDARSPNLLVWASTAMPRACVRCWARKFIVRSLRCNHSGRGRGPVREESNAPKLIAAQQSFEGSFQAGGS